MKIGIVGASGYSGGELLRLLEIHPDFELEYIAAGSQANLLIRALHPHLTGYEERTFEETKVSRMNDCQLIFFALPPGESSKLISQVNPEIKVVDLGADFRLHSEDSWQKYYGGEHAGTWAYGLPELEGQRSRIIDSHRVANPGCYATAIALAAAPALKLNLIDGSDIVVVAASGTTGAGRKADTNLLASQVMGSLSSYKFGGTHQHTPEIEETLTSVWGSQVKISFTPILAPMPRGILATLTAPLNGIQRTDLVHAIYSSYYKDEAFVSVLPPNLLPRTASVLGSNSIHLQVAVDEHTNRLIVSSVIDNLGKGAASQAIQNSNLMVGLPESTGLNASGLGI